MQPGNIIKQIEQSKGQGDGFLYDVSISPSQMNVSNATRAVTDNLDRIILDANSEVALFNWVVPGNYDRQRDRLSCSFFAEYISGTSLVVTADLERLARAGSAQAAVTLTGTGVTIQSTSVGSYVTITANGLGLRPGDVVSFTATASSVTGSGIAHILGARVRYASTLALYNESER